MGEIFLLEILRRCPRELQNTLIGSTCETWKNVFYFTSKVLFHFVLEKIKV